MILPNAYISKQKAFTGPFVIPRRSQTQIIPPRNAPSANDEDHKGDNFGSKSDWVDEDNVEETMMTF